MQRPFATTIYVHTLVVLHHSLSRMLAVAALAIPRPRMRTCSLGSVSPPCHFVTPPTCGSFWWIPESEMASGSLDFREGMSLVSKPSFRSPSSFFFLVLESTSFCSVPDTHTPFFFILALCAAQYPVCRPAWVDFVPDHKLGRSALPPAYAEYPSFSPLPLTAPAVLSFLSLAPHRLTGADALQPTSPTVPSSVSPQSSEWDCEWERCKRLAGKDAPTTENPSATFKPGTMEGVWEGLFTVSSFHAIRFFSSPAFGRLLTRERTLLVQFSYL